MITRYFPILLATLALLATAAIAQDTSVTLTTAGISRTITWPDGHIGAGSIENRATGRTYQIAEDGFEIRIDGIEKPITEKTATVTRAEPTPRSVTLDLTDPALPGVKLQVIYQLGPADFYGRKSIRIIVPDGQTLPIASITVEKIRFTDPVKPSHEGRGQPVYIDDLFFGLEWPIGDDVVKENLLTCTHWPAWDVKGDYESKRAVWGAAPEGEVANWFLERYVPTIRVTPPRPILLYNSWYDVRGPDLAQYNEAIDGFRDKLSKPFGINLESFVVDDGWQNKQTIYQTLFPDDMDALRKNIESQLPGCKLGLWMPIGGGGTGLDRKWGRENGYEVITRDAAYCLVGPKFTAEMEKRVHYFMDDLGVTYFKHDFNEFVCDIPGHGHRTEGMAARESQVEGMLRWMRMMREINPDVYLNYTSSMNLSPWWLMGCDCVWFAGSDNGLAGAGTPRERAITFRDFTMHRNCVERKDQFPSNSIMTHGIIKGRFCYNWADRPIEEWQHDVLMYFGRGISMWELYFTPSLLTDEEWAFLAKTIKWERANYDVMSQSTRLILGDVTKQEPYGYTHAKDSRCIVFIRHPGGLDPDAVTLSRDWKVLRTDNADRLPEGFERAEFDDSLWQSVEIPDGQEAPYTDLALAYRLHFTVPAAWKGEAIEILFPNADDDAVVFLNGAKIGSHKGYGESFGFDVTKQLQYDGDNVLAVKIDSEGGPAGLSGTIQVGRVGRGRDVTFDFSAKACGFDPKYRHAQVTWVYPEGRTDPATLDLGAPTTFQMKPFDLYVLDLKLSE